MNKSFFVILWILFFVAHGTVNYITHYLGKEFYSKHLENTGKHTKLLDSLYNLVPDLHGIPVLDIGFDIILIFVVLYIFFTNSKASFELLSISLVVYSIRLIFLISTVLPKYSKCEDNSFNWVNLVKGHCYDKVFSGHLSLALITAFILMKHYGIPLVAAGGYVFISAIVILFIRSHYTVDLLVAFLVVFSVIASKLYPNVS